LTETYYNKVNIQPVRFSKFEFRSVVSFQYSGGGGGGVCVGGEKKKN